MKNKSSALMGVVGVAALGCLLAPRAGTQVRAQPNAPANAPARAPQRADFGANKQIIRLNGVRLEGNAFINRPELSVNADVIALDYNDRQITQVRARGKVNFKLDLPARAGPASGTPSGAPARVEATCNEATLDPATRTLVLTGDVDGFYQVRGGGRNTLRGDKATLRYPTDRQLLAEVEGGARGVRLVVSGDAAGAGGDAASIGNVVLTASRAIINEADGTARLIGGARAVSDDGPNTFEMNAPEFVLSRDEAGAFNTLKTSGRTRLRFDLPPEPGPNARPNAPNANAPNANAPNANAPDANAPNAAAPGAAGGDVQRSYAFVFEGKVEGSYRLQAAGAAPKDYRFNGDRADIRIKYVPEPENARTSNATAPNAGPNAAPNAPSNAAPARARGGIERPTQVQVAADGVTMRRIVTRGVAGLSARLRPELEAEITGEPSTIQVPVFDLGF